MIVRPQEVTILCAADSPLSTALAAGLNALGWRCEIHRGIDSPVGLAVVVLENDRGIASSVQLSVPLSKAICLGSRRSLGYLIEWCEGGGVVLNLELPFPRLLSSVSSALDGVMRGTVGRREAVLGNLRQLMGEQAALATLTRREHEVLLELVNGRVAEEIAADGYRSLPTIRSQIQSVLRKLGVVSQVSAIAMANRAGLQEWHRWAAPDFIIFEEDDNAR